MRTGSNHPMTNQDHRRLEVRVSSGAALDVRTFHVAEKMNELFEIVLTAVSEDPDLDFEAIAGHPINFAVHRDVGENDSHRWGGLCRHIEQVNAEERGLSTYQLIMVPRLWLLTQRRNYRMFQRESELDIVRKLLNEWGVPFSENLTGSYGKREYRVQYGETDFAFMCRMLEDAGVSFYFSTQGGETKVVLSDAPDKAPPRDPAIAYRENPTVASKEHVTRMRFGRSIRPGKVTVRDHDHRRPPSFELKGGAGSTGQVESALEQFDYRPGAFTFESDKGDSNPSADDRGKFRTDDRAAAAFAEKRLAGERASAQSIRFETNTVDLAPGTVVSFLDHPKAELAPGKGYLVVESSFSGKVNESWTCACSAVSAAGSYHPPVVTPRPKTSGVESATVVGPAGDEIHTDEFGRVRVHFHWDRESRMNEKSSCWIHVSQPWGGSGFGGTNLPRIGQEVIVDFLGGDPDKPVITGRLYTALQTTPYKLPDNKTQSGWKSRSSPGGDPDNFNEIMFEDRKGKELLRMQAEKDLDKLVKNDERVKIGHDRQKRVEHDDALSVGNDRTREVGHDESVRVVHDRTREVGHDESLSIGNDRERSVGNDERVQVGANQTIQVVKNRTRLVGMNETVTIGMNNTRAVGVNETLFVGVHQNEQIGGNRSVKVKKNHSEKIGKNKSVKVGKAKTETVKLASTETVGLAKTCTVGAAYTLTVGGIMTTTVAMKQIENVGMTKSVTVGQKIEITCGAASIVLEASGKIAIKGTEITVNGETITMEAAKQAHLKGGTTKIEGDPIDLN
ncbi:MAG: type VI secretion system tip protein VgrG [Polyangiaceae bacterium]|nr:type VI secretion system tip protein VgrG [Polyangiaceae bacterium]